MSNQIDPDGIHIISTYMTGDGTTDDEKPESCSSQKRCSKNNLCSGASVYNYRFENMFEKTVVIDL